MRLSGDPKDPGWNIELSIRAVIWIDDVRYDHVVTADEEEGYALIEAHDWDGVPVVDREKVEIVTYETYGKVEIEFRK